MSETTLATATNSTRRRRAIRPAASHNRCAWVTSDPFLLR